MQILSRRMALGGNLFADNHGNARTEISEPSQFPPSLSSIPRTNDESLCTILVSPLLTYIGSHILVGCQAVSNDGHRTTHDGIATIQHSCSQQRNTADSVTVHHTCYNPRYSSVVAKSPPTRFHRRAIINVAISAAHNRSRGCCRREYSFQLQVSRESRCISPIIVMHEATTARMPQGSLSLLLPWGLHLADDYPFSGGSWICEDDVCAV